MSGREVNTAFIKKFVRQVIENEDFGIIFDCCNFKSNKNNKIIEFMEQFGILLLESYIKKTETVNEKYLDIEEVKKSLNYKDLRSVAQWCKKHGVFILEQGKRHLVSKLEFLASFHKPLMEHLKSIATVKPKLTTAEASEKTLTSKIYTPKSETGKSFLSTLKKL
ncbi:MAG: hypothetical protein HYZ14_03020 [Bacteroidetes bacterium]|nr:hypothetical protein [Bacteroidota bacterium]